MDINSLLNTQSLLASNRSLENTLNLKVGQQLDVKTISADITAAKNAITLSLGNTELSVQSNQPVTLSPGQALKLQVTQIAPVIEFKIIAPLPELKAQAMDLRLKLLSTTSDSGNTSGLNQPSTTDATKIATGKEISSSLTPATQTNQTLEAKIINISGNKIQLQLNTNSTTTATTDIGNKQTGLITLERSQLTNAPADLKIGQSLSLEVTKTGATPEFKIITPSPAVSEVKIAEFVKQFLPRHADAQIFLNQLIKDLPQLMNNQTIPQSLKDIATQIIQNLPPKEQLISSQGLKQALVNSGLFLEAKLPAQAELIKALPLLIKNESLPLSLQRIASEILQNLTQKQPLLNSPPIPLKPLSDLELAALKLSIDTQTTTKADTLGAEDFKANLLKFIGALKQELGTQNEQLPNQVDLDLLKNLQNKSENTVAKIVLDQLLSLPKDDNQKQLWVIDIPFVNRQQAESVRIEVQRDKEKQQQAGSQDWSVNITITPPELGTIHCLVSYRNEVINTFFKSQSIQTTELIKHNLEYLKNQLEESGLKTGHLDAYDGAHKTQPTHHSAGKPLFDDKA